MKAEVADEGDAGEDETVSIKPVEDFDVEIAWLFDEGPALENEVSSNIQSEAVTYKSVDTVVEADEVVNYPAKFFNSLDLPNIPSHVRQLKIGLPIIMLRNINKPKHCNATRLAVKKINRRRRRSNNLTEPFKGEDVLIPRIPMIPTDMPFHFKRL
ncbi:uncharacterized protein [Procambarus clarkii]|uniref:uncharacterized protein n=1 Tax=Procambarus clarkii TaxID=6728 RepID=UPI0037442F7F